MKRVKSRLQGAAGRRLWLKGEFLLFPLSFPSWKNREHIYHHNKDNEKRIETEAIRKEKGWLMYKCLEKWEDRNSLKCAEEGHKSSEFMVSGLYLCEIEGEVPYWVTDPTKTLVFGIVTKRNEQIKDKKLIEM